MSPVERNPHVFGPPIRRKEDFFGRAQEMRSVLSSLQNAASVSIVGERRIGKTSLLYRIQDVITSDERYHAEMVPILINPQLAIRDEGEFFGRVIHYLAPQVGELGAAKTGNADAAALIYCLEALLPRRLVLLIDEFEAVSGNDALGQRFFSSLRGMAENLQVSIITASKTPLADCCDKSSISSKFSDIFRTIFLGPFSQQELDEFLAESARQSNLPFPKWQAQIQDLAGGFPAFTQLACIHYYEAAAKAPDQELTAADHARIRQAYTLQVEPYFSRIWGEDLDEEEKRALLSLALGHQDRNGAALQRLQKKGYVNDGRIFSSVFGELFLGHQPRKVTQAVQEETEEQSDIQLDGNGEVWVAGDRVTPPLTNLQYELLAYLYRNRGRISSKYDIVEAVWSDDYIDKVDDHRISKLVSRLRERIEPCPSEPRYVQTVHGRGYRLAGSARSSDDDQ